MISCEDAYSWLNLYGKGSFLDAPVSQIVFRMKETLKQALEKNNRDFAEVNHLIALALEVGESFGLTYGLAALAETHLECAYACYQMGDLTRAILEYRRAICFYAGSHQHNEAVARWLIGCALWLRSEPGDAFSEWGRCRTIFQLLRGSSENFEWYDKQLTEMSATIQRAVALGRWPFD